MKVYINRMPVKGPWGGGNRFISAMYEHLPKLGHSVVSANDLRTKPDCIFLVGTSVDGYGISAEQAVMYKSVINTDCKLVLRVNENDARKNTGVVDDALLELSKHVDSAVFVSNWLRSYFDAKGWPKNKSSVIKNGVDRNVFRSYDNKLNNSKTNIVTAHWSDNSMKGQEYAEWLDDFVSKNSKEYTYSYIGRTRAKLKHSTVVSPLDGSRLAEEMSKYDVCINATKHDPGPNSVIEPIACGLPTYVHKDGGGAVEFAGEDHVFSSEEELKTLLLNKKFTSNKDDFLPWHDVISNVSKQLES